MTKSIIVTDTHLGHKGGSDQYHDICMELFHDISFVAKEKGIKRFFHGGDFFNTRKAISLKSIPIAYNIIEILTDTFDDVYLIVGNHDIYYKDRLDPTSLQLFDNIEGVKVVDIPIVVGNIHLQPWLLEEFQPVKVPYILGHFEMSGITINRVGTESKSGIPISLFKDYKMVMSGHYHTRSETKNIRYLGSPYHMTFNDDGPRGFYIFDDENGDLEFIEFTKYPKFEVFTHKNIDFDKIKGNNVRITFTEDIGTTKVNTINNKVYECEPNQLFIEFSFDDSFGEEINNQEVSEIIDIRTIEKKYLDNATIPEYIDRTIIEGHMDTLWKQLREKK